MWWHLEPAQIAAVALAAAAAWFDVRTGRIPNPLSLVGIAAGLIWGAATGGLEGLAWAVVGGLVTALVPMLLFRFQAMGGGDVKLLCALGALLGTRGGLELETLAFVAGAAHGIAVWAVRGQLLCGARAIAGRVLPFARGRLRAGVGVEAAAATTIRFAPSILIGTVAAQVLGAVG